jgi:tRNA(Ile2) C34 agmatinyltransferase TiaS
MSDLGTKIMAAGLVAEGLAVEILEQEFHELTEVVARSVPVCPACQSAMRKTNYEGYYESFSYWACDCEYFEDGTTWNGSYA